jgi:GNAT superfamily N-acetyltransferase
MEPFVRSFQSGDMREIVGLLDEVFKGWPHLDLGCSSLDHWKWKYLDNPLGEAVISVACDGDRIVGVNHSYPIRIKIGDGIHASSFAADTAVQADYRGLGISVKMIEQGIRSRQEKGTKFTYFVTRHPRLIRMNSKRYPIFPRSITNLVRIRDIDYHLEAMPMDRANLLKLGFKGAKLMNKLKHRSEKNVSGSIRVSDVESFDERIDLLWDKVALECDFSMERRREYLNWRYCDPRSGGFTIRLAAEGGDIVGYSVMRINKYNKEYPIGYIVDIFAPPRRLDILNALASDAAVYFDDGDVNIVNCLAIKDHQQNSVLAAYGFLDSRVKVHLFYLSEGIGNNLAQMSSSRPNSVYFSYGDIDSLPVEMAHH